MSASVRGESSANADLAACVLRDGEYHAVSIVGTTPSLSSPEKVRRAATDLRSRTSR